MVQLRGNFYRGGGGMEGGRRGGGSRDGARARSKSRSKPRGHTEKLMNDKELTSFRKLTNWSTVKKSLVFPLLQKGIIRKTNVKPFEDGDLVSEKN